ncbi:unnamed protein product, partial [Ectocarpus sp. 8 AP-2014]
MLDARCTDAQLSVQVGGGGRWEGTNCDWVRGCTASPVAASLAGSLFSVVFMWQSAS